MSKIGLVTVVSAEISRNVEFAGAAKEGQLILNVDKEKLARDIVGAVTDYIKKEHWLVVKNYLVENILT